MATRSCVLSTVLLEPSSSEYPPRICGSLKSVWYTAKIELYEDLCYVSCKSVPLSILPFHVLHNHNIALSCDPQHSTIYMALQRIYVIKVFGKTTMPFLLCTAHMHGQPPFVEGDLVCLSLSAPINASMSYSPIPPDTEGNDLHTK